jgi:Fe-S-cluster containining protein
MDILIKAKENYKRTLAFLKSLENHDRDKVESLLYPIHDEIFTKTDCLECANCCKTSPPIITTEDVNRISKHISISKKQFKRNYILEDLDKTMSFINVPCTFLDTDNKCSIYEVRPLACRNYPHTRQKGFTMRSKLNAENTLICPAAFKIIERLESRI